MFILILAVVLNICTTLSWLCHLIALMRHSAASYISSLQCKGARHCDVSKLFYADITTTSWPGGVYLHFFFFWFDFYRWCISMTACRKTSDFYYILTEYNCDFQVSSLYSPKHISHFFCHCQTSSIETPPRERWWNKTFWCQPPMMANSHRHNPPTTYFNWGADVPLHRHCTEVPVCKKREKKGAVAISDCAQKSLSLQTYT